MAPPEEDDDVSVRSNGSAASNPAPQVKPSPKRASGSFDQSRENRMDHRDKLQKKQEEKWTSAHRETKKGKLFFWWRSYSIEFRELLVYLIFLVLYMFVSFGPVGTTMDRYQLKAGLTANVHPSFDSVGSASELYGWLADELLPNLYAPEWDVAAQQAAANGRRLRGSGGSGSSNGEDDDEAAVDDDNEYVGVMGRNFAADGVNRRIGTVRLRLVRVVDWPGDIPSVHAEEVQFLHPEYRGALSMETADYEVGGATGTLRWATGAALGNRGETLCTGTGISYPPSGYVVDLPGGLDAAVAMVRQLEADGLIDLATRAVFVDYSVYNANSDQFGVATLVCQFLASGLVRPEAKVSAAPLLSTYRVLVGDSSSKTWTWLTFCEMSLYVVVMALIEKEWLVFKAIGKTAYFADGFAGLDLANYAMFMGVMVARFNLILNLWYLSDELAADEGLAFVNLTKLSVTFDWTETASSINCVITFIKVFKYLRPIKKLALFTETLRLASGDMVYMSGIIAIALLAFGSAFSLAFGPDMFVFTTLGRTYLTLFRAMLGDFDIDSLVASNHVLGPFLFTLFVLLIFFVVMSMFLSIVDEAYDNVRNALEEKAGDPPEPLERDIVRFQAEVASKFYGAVEFATGLKLGPSPLPKPRPGPRVEALAALKAAEAKAAALESLSPGDRAFARRREEVAGEASSVAKALGAAFAQLELLGDQQAEMALIMTAVDDRLMRRKAKEAAAQAERATSGADASRRVGGR